MTRLAVLLDFDHQARDGFFAWHDHLMGQAGGNMGYVAGAEFLASAI